MIDGLRNAYEGVIDRGARDLRPEDIYKMSNVNILVWF